jgi:Fe-Mn family superoxide dismutase
MMYSPREFSIPELKGISRKQIDVHLALYEGYIKHLNLILDKIEQFRNEDAEGNAYIMAELRRRFNFEFDGMRMHEYYFEQLEGGALRPQGESPLMDAAVDRYSSWEGFIAHIKEVCGTRGVGWTIVYYDPSARKLHTAWITDQEIGQLAGLPIILAIDMWEHAYMVDYMPADKKNYVDAFLENVNWEVIEKRFLSEVV